MSKSCVAVLFSLTIVRTFLRKDFIAFFDGLMSNFPLYFRTFCPRKSKPSLICVITVFFLGELQAAFRQKVLDERHNLVT